MVYVSIRVLAMTVYAFLKNTVNRTLTMDTLHPVSSYLNLSSFKECPVQFRNVAAVINKVSKCFPHLLFGELGDLLIPGPQAHSCL